MSGFLIAVTSLVAAHGLWALGFSVVQAHGLDSCGTWALVALRHMGPPQIRNQTHIPCIGTQILYHRAIREVPFVFIFEGSFGYQLSYT